jgi:hypothetical protein
MTPQTETSLGDIVLFIDRRGNKWPAMVVYLVSSEVVDLRIFNNQERGTQVEYNVTREMKETPFSWKPRY